MSVCNHSIDKMQCGVFPNLSAAHRNSCSGPEYSPRSSNGQLKSPQPLRTSTASQSAFFHPIRGLEALRIGLNFKTFKVKAQIKPSSGDGGDEDGDKEVQETLVEILRLETGKVRVNEFVEEQAKHLTDIAETANEEYARIAEEAKRTMDAAGSKVLEEIDSKASAFEEELAAARAEIEADEADFEAFEKNVERARNEGLFFKELYRTVKTKTPEEQQQIKEKAKEVAETVKTSAGSKPRRVLYGVLIVLLTLSIIEAGSSGDVQLPKLAIYVLLLLAVIVQLAYENKVATKNKTDKED